MQATSEDWALQLDVRDGSAELANSLQRPSFWAPSRAKSMGLGSTRSGLLRQARVSFRKTLIVTSRHPHLNVDVVHLQTVGTSASPVWCACTVYQNLHAHLQVNNHATGLGDPIRLCDHLQVEAGGDVDSSGGSGWAKARRVATAQVSFQSLQLSPVIRGMWPAAAPTALSLHLYHGTLRRVHAFACRLQLG